MKFVVDKHKMPAIDFQPVVINDGQRIIIEETLKAIIDTGSRDCFIEKTLANELGLEPNGTKTKINRLLKGFVEADNYDLLIHIPHLKRTIGFQAVEMNDGYTYPIVLGTLFLSMFEFTYNGKDQTFQLRFLND
jgi:hypothetical protein